MGNIKRWILGVIMLTQKIVSYIPSHLVRNAIYKHIFQLKIGKGVTIYSGVELRSPWKIIIGDNSIIGHDCILDGRRSLIIGKNVNISSGTWIWTLQHDPQSVTFEAVGGTVNIKDFVWLCSRSTILPSVTVGEGTVVAASSVVTKTTESNIIVGGIPAKKISNRITGLNYRLGLRIPFV